MIAEVLGPAAAAALAAWAVRGRSSSILSASVWHGARSKPAIALTFDDGPSESTPRILAILREYGARATFFQCGCHVRRLPEISRLVLSLGHELGNHTDTHEALYLRSPGFIYEQLARAQDSIIEVTGTPPRLFRPPYGARWPGLRSAQRRLGLLGAMWTVIGQDWRLPAPAIAQRILTHLENGAILCLHDGRERAVNPDIRETVEAVRRIVPALLERGYALETVSGMLAP